MHNPHVDDVKVQKVVDNVYDVTIKFNMLHLTSDMMGPTFVTDFDHDTSIVSPPSYDPPTDTIFYRIKIGATMVNIQ
jgi:hypothetical protein